MAQRRIVERQTNRTERMDGQADRQTDKQFVTLLLVLVARSFVRLVVWLLGRFRGRRCGESSTWAK